MPEIDRIKADIAFHEKLFFAALAIVFALTGWITTHYPDSDVWLLLLALVGLICSVGFGVLQYRAIKQLIKELGKC